jgi:hypothetical protein
VEHLRWLTLKYPLPKDKRIALAKLYYEVCVLPGMQMDVVSSCMDTLAMLVRSKRKLSIDDLRLPWKPVYRLLKKDLFLKRRQFEIRSAPPLCSVKLFIETPYSARQRTRWALLQRLQGDSFTQHVLMKCCKNLCPASSEVISMYVALPYIPAAWLT